MNSQIRLLPYENALQRSRGMMKTLLRDNLASFQADGHENIITHILVIQKRKPQRPQGPQCIKNHVHVYSNNLDPI